MNSIRRILPHYLVAANSIRRHVTRFEWIRSYVIRGKQIHSLAMVLNELYGDEIRRGRGAPEEPDNRPRKFARLKI